MNERRAEPRLKVLKTGKIVLGASGCLFDCRIRDVASGGARLRLDNSWQIPERFEFASAAGAERQPARVVWRGDRELGIALG